MDEQIVIQMPRSVHTGVFLHYIFFFYLYLMFFSYFFYLTFIYIMFLMFYLLSGTSIMLLLL